MCEGDDSSGTDSRNHGGEGSGEGQRCPELLCARMVGQLQLAHHTKKRSLPAGDHARLSASLLEIRDQSSGPPLQ